MKDHTDQEGATLRAEVAALRQQVQALAAQQVGSNTRTRWGLTQSCKLLLPVCLLLTAVGVLYGQGAMDALFIDQNGNVGIGTNPPTAALDVSGKANTDKQISLQLRSGNNSNNYQSNQITFAWSGSDTYRHAIKTRHHGGQQADNAIDFYVWKYDKDKVDPTAIGGLHTMTLDGGNVGIGGITSPKERLEVNGRIKDQTGYVMPVGTIVAYYGKTAPEGWLLCDGGAIPSDEKYKSLRDLLGANTPNLGGRTLIGSGQGHSFGEQGGEERHQLTVAEMPSHNHHGFGEAYNDWPFGVVGKNQRGSRGGADNDNYYYNTSTTGGNTPFNNMQPYSTVNYIIKY